MPVAIARLFSFEGPNIISPIPGVLAELYATWECSAAARHAVKAAGQQVGVVIGSLNMVSTPLQEQHRIVITFTTPTPAIGSDIIRYVVDGLNAREAGDETWDEDEPIWQLQQRRRAEALPIAALQLIAKARQRDLPAFRRPDGQLQIGLGGLGMSTDIVSLPESSEKGADLEIPWSRLSTIPIIAISGVPSDGELITMIVDWFQQRGYAVGQAQSANFDQVRALLCRPGIDLAVVELAPESLLQHGLPFDVCDMTVLSGMPSPLTGAINAEEAARAVALPLLVTKPNGRALINQGSPELVALAAYAPCQVETNGALTEALVRLLNTEARQFISLPTQAAG